MFNKHGYYTTDKLKSYKGKFFIVASERGIGKTYGEKRALFRNFKKRGHRFACIYRQGPDMMSALPTWLDPILHPAPRDHSKPADPSDFKWVGAGKVGTAINLMYQGTVIGYFRCLAAANNVKLESFPLDISEVFFDEFAPVVWKKLPGIESEGEALQIIIDTMDHDSRHRKTTQGYPPIRTFMFCNPRNRTSPLYDYFKIPALKFGVHRIDRDTVYEGLQPRIVNTMGGAEEARTCRAYQEVLSYVKKIPPGAVPFNSYRFHDHHYCLWLAPDKKSYLSRERGGHRKVQGGRWYGSIDNLSEKELCLTHRTKNGTMAEKLLQRYTAGRDYFESAETKYSYMQDILDL